MEEFFTPERLARIEAARVAREEKREVTRIRNAARKEARKLAIKEEYQTDKSPSSPIQRRLICFDLMGGKCQACGLVDDPIAYDYHHIDPTTKSFDISTFFSPVCKETGIGVDLEEELTKCVLVCAICHRKIHAGKIPCPEKDKGFIGVTDIPQ